MFFDPPDVFNIANYFLDARVREGKGDRIALRTDDGVLTYAEVAAMANRFGNAIREAGVRPEQRVLIALPDIPEYAAALFGALKIGGVVVMVNPHLKSAEVRHLFRYARAAAAVVHSDALPVFRDAAGESPLMGELLVVGDDATERRLASMPEELESFPSHPDDPAIWLFSGGTTGHPKGVVQSHRSFANTTECYAKRVIEYTEDDVTLSVPKLYFGYATGSNLFFPFSVGASAVLFPERCVTEVLFEKIARHRPTILINVPTMVSHMVGHEEAPKQDLSCLRLATSAGEALPSELHDRWNAAFGVDLLDGLGTAEMWHVFISNRPGDVRAGTLGTAVPGFEIRVCDEDGTPLPDGEVGTMWVRGDSRAIGYWQHYEQTRHAFRGEWYVSGDMIRRDPDGTITYCGRTDDMLKVSGKWVSPKEVEGCLLRHPDIAEAALVGVTDPGGLTKPYAFVVLGDGGEPSESEIQTFVRNHLAPHKYPRKVFFVEGMPRTHLGKVDRGKLRASVEASGTRKP
jgi:benzoate-CoA ligase family protein